MSEWQACPVCKGSKLVSRPPGVPADQETFVATGSGPWPCQICSGTGLLEKPDSAAKPDDPWDQFGDVWSRVTSVVDGFLGKPKRN